MIDYLSGTASVKWLANGEVELTASGRSPGTGTIILTAAEFWALVNLVEIVED